MPLVIRQANEKGLTEISAETHAAQGQALAPGQQWLDPRGETPSPRQWRIFFAPPWALRDA
ncbi:MAG TPA: hypothetical protein VIL51_07545 [Thermoleophilia bacterium]